MIVTYSARSHIGKIRRNNEDNLFTDGVMLPCGMSDRPFSIDVNSSTPVVLAVCDGMGGEDNGEIASMTAVEQLSNYNELIKNCSSQMLNEIVQRYVNDVNIVIRSKASNEGRRVGTTLALVIITNSGVHCFNIGDTRIYRLKKNAIYQISNDHTLVAEAVKGGVITAEQARYEKDRHKLTRCIGIGEKCEIESYLSVHGTSRLLICSDGLTDMVTDYEIEKILAQTKKTADAADDLIDLALKHGGNDNITVIVIDTANPRNLIGRIADKFRKLR